MKYSKRSIIGLLAITLIASTYVAAVWAGTGSIRIDPPLPYMNGSPADFTVWVQGKDDACEPIILLVMTDSSYKGLNSPVEVMWSGGSATLSPWTEETTNKGGVDVPPWADKTPYNVANLRSHLETEESIWWTWGRILGDELTAGEIYEITVKLDSDAPEMLVYIMGKSECSGGYDMAVPPTIPGFVVPEVPIGTILSAITMLGTAALYKIKRK